MERLGLRHFARVYGAVTAMTLRLHLRRRRTWVMAVLVLLPTLIPPVAAHYAPGPAGPPAPRLFVALAEFLYLYTLVPLTALFYACSLLADEIEGRTLPLLLARPVPRSALVLGKFTAYLCVSVVLVSVSFAGFFQSCNVFLGLARDGTAHGHLARYAGLAALGLASYGALCLAISALTRRPALLSALFIFGWEKLVIALPGYVDFLTLQKYLGCLLPAVPFRRLAIAKVELPVELMRTVYPVSPGAALVVLIGVTVVLLGVACAAVRARQFAAGAAE